MHSLRALRRESQFYLQITLCLHFLRKRSPDGAISLTEVADIQLQLTTHLSTPEGMKGCVGLVGWPMADGLPTQVVIRQLQVDRRAQDRERSPTKDWTSLKFYRCATQPRNIGLFSADISNTWQQL